MRQLARSYLQHARRHAIGGSDPIPGFGSLPVMYAAGTLSAFLPSSVTATTVPLDDLFSGLSDSAVFDLDHSTDEFKILTNGVYLALISVAMFINPNTADADAYAEAAWNLTDDHGSGLLGGSHELWNGDGEVTLGGSIPLNVDDAPTFSGIALTQTSGHTANVFLEAMVIRISTTPLTLS